MQPTNFFRCAEGRNALFCFVLALGLSFQIMAQTPAPATSAAVRKTTANVTDVPSVAQEATDAGEEGVVRDMYRKFHETYKLGANDEIAVRVLGQPEYSLERAKVSPVGRIYHPLLGDVEVAGRTVPQLTEELTKELSEYVLQPRVSISLLETRSAKIGVLGEVVRPGIFVMVEPLKVLEAITAAGGFTEYGSKTNVTVYRQDETGQISARDINIKKLLSGKATPQENLALQPGDTVMVKGNAKKKVALVSSLAGISSFMTILARGR